MKKLLLFVLLIITMPLISYVEDTTQIAKEEFSQYYNGKNEVVLNIEDNLYFENYIITNTSFSPECLYGSIIFHNNNIYYLSFESSKMGLKNDAILIYSCDLFGENIKEIYTKELNIYSKVKIKTNKDTFYLQYTKEDKVFIDKYTISSGIYENIDSGEDCSLSNYIQEEQSIYDIEVIEDISPVEHGKFIITDPNTGIVNTIDDEYLKNTIYIKSMQKFNYSPKRVDISNGHILLTYSIGAGDGWNYPYLIFEYDFNLNSLEYKMLAFTYDSVPIDIIYIG